MHGSSLMSRAAMPTSGQVKEAKVERRAAPRQKPKADQETSRPHPSASLFATLGQPIVPLLRASSMKRDSGPWRLANGEPRAAACCCLLLLSCFLFPDCCSCQLPGSRRPREAAARDLRWTRLLYYDVGHDRTWRPKPTTRNTSPPGPPPPTNTDQQTTKKPTRKRPK